MINPDATITLFNGSIPSEIQDEIMSHIPKDLLNLAQVNKEANKKIHDLLKKNVSNLKRKNLAMWNFCHKNENVEVFNNFDLNKTFNSLDYLLKYCSINSDGWYSFINPIPLVHWSIENVYPDLFTEITSFLNKSDKAALAVTCKTIHNVIKNLLWEEMRVVHFNREFNAHLNQNI